MRNQRLEWDEDGHFLSLSGEPQAHEGLIFTHREMHHCPAGTAASIKAACSFFDTLGKGCPQMMTAQVYNMKCHLKNLQGVAKSAIASYDLQTHCAKVSKSASQWPRLFPVE